MMPMVDGFATLEQIKKKQLTFTLQHFSQKIRRKIKRTFVRANLYVTKAFSIKKLVEQVQELIR
jgi:DNA-binding response OmpR family regulator